MTRDNPLASEVAVWLTRTHDGEFTLRIQDELSRRLVIEVHLSPLAVANLISTRAALGRAELSDTQFFGLRQVQKRTTRTLNVAAFAPVGRIRDAIENLKAGAQVGSGVFLRTLEESQGGLTPHPTKKNKSILKVIELRYVNPNDYTQDKDQDD